MLGSAEAKQLMVEFELYKKEVERVRQRFEEEVAIRSREQEYAEQERATDIQSAPEARKLEKLMQQQMAILEKRERRVRAAEAQQQLNLEAFKTKQEDEQQSKQRAAGGVTTSSCS